LIASFMAILGKITHNDPFIYISDFLEIHS
jgi:hypothetical protein